LQLSNCSGRQVIPAGSITVVGMAWQKMAPTVALATMLVAGCSLSTNSTAAHGVSVAPSRTPAAQAAAHGVEAAIGTIPWSQVGRGWMLATWSPVAGGSPGAPPPPGAPTYQTAATTLYLVDPAGGRYPITSFPPPGRRANPELVDWSGDGSHALLDAPDATPPTAIMVDLHTGAQTTVPAPGSRRYSRPDGTALPAVIWTCRPTRPAAAANRSSTTTRPPTRRPCCSGRHSTAVA